MSDTATRFIEAQSQEIEWLFVRWIDERNYENMGDYREVLQQLAEPFGVKVLLGPTRQAFSFRFSCTEGGLTKTYLYQCTEQENIFMPVS